MTNIKHVATLAGVSASTVSRVLNGKSYVNETTRQKVMEAVQKTNYRPNVLAKSLKMGRSNTICLMVPSIQNLIFRRSPGAWRMWRAVTVSRWCCATPMRMRQWKSIHRKDENTLD